MTMVIKHGRGQADRTVIWEQLIGLTPELALDLYDNHQNKKIDKPIREVKTGGNHYKHQ